LEAAKLSSRLNVLFVCMYVYVCVCVCLSRLLQPFKVFLPTHVLYIRDSNTI
jgi:hypothetical protein